MQIFLEILGEGYTQSLILIITVAVTAIIYFLQKRDERRNAARMIVMQIDSMNKRVDSLMRAVGTDISRFDLEKFGSQRMCLKIANGISINSYLLKEWIIMR